MRVRPYRQLSSYPSSSVPLVSTFLWQGTGEGLEKHGAVDVIRKREGKGHIFAWVGCYNFPRWDLFIEAHFSNSTTSRSDSSDVFLDTFLFVCPVCISCFSPSLQASCRRVASTRHLSLPWGATDWTEDPSLVLETLPWLRTTVYDPVAGFFLYDQQSVVDFRKTSLSRLSHHHTHLRHVHLYTYTYIYIYQRVSRGREKETSKERYRLYLRGGAVILTCAASFRLRFAFT